MRVKLVFLVSLAGAVIGAGVPIAIEKLVYGSIIQAAYLNRHVTTGNLIDLIPVVVSISAGIFVYRRTAHWRKLQAVVAAVLVLLLSCVALIASIVVL